VSEGGPVTHQTWKRPPAPSCSGSPASSGTPQPRAACVSGTAWSGTPWAAYQVRGSPVRVPGKHRPVPPGAAQAGASAYRTLALALRPCNDAANDEPATRRLPAAGVAVGPAAGAVARGAGCGPAAGCAARAQHGSSPPGTAVLLQPAHVAAREQTRTPAPAYFVCSAWLAPGGGGATKGRLCGPAGCVRYGCGEPARPPVREQPSAPAPEPVEARCLGSAPEQALPPEPAAPRRAAGWEGFEQPPPAAASTAGLRLCEQAALGRAARPEGPRQPHPAAASGRTRDESAGADAAAAAGVAAAAAAGGCSSHPLADLSDSGEGGDETRSVSSCSSSGGGLPWLRDARSGQGLRSHPVAVPYGDDDAPPASEVGSDWRAALHDKQPCLLPVTWPSSAAAPVQTPGQTGGASEPASAAPSDRVGVFSDLHSRGCGPLHSPEACLRVP